MQKNQVISLKNISFLCILSVQDMTGVFSCLFYAVPGNGICRGKDRITGFKTDDLNQEG